MGKSVLCLVVVLGALVAYAQDESPPVEKLTSFDYRLAELRWQGDRWQLWAGVVCLKDFGKRESEGREVVRIVRELHLTQHAAIGIPEPIVEYWLADGRAPQGPSPSSRVIAFDPASLRVDSLQGQWCVRDLRHIAFHFIHEAEARRTLAIIRHYGFNQVGYVGQAPPSMMYFLATPSTRSQSPVPSEETHAAAKRGHALSGATGQGKTITPVSLPSGRQLTIARAPLPGQLVIGERATFDWRQVKIRQDDKNWMLVCGSKTLADFGPNESAARQALSAVQHYHFTEQYCIGRPTPSFTYFLVNGQEPRGLCLGVNNIAFDWESLSVRQIEGKFVISESDRILFHFGDDGDEAKQALAAIQHYQFDHLCHIGPPSPLGMSYFVRTHFRKTNREAPTSPAHSLPMKERQN
jgi:hypothetical protein